MISYIDESIKSVTSKLYSIDPYDNVVISLGDVDYFIDVCDFILKKVPEQNYGEIDKGNIGVEYKA